MEPQQHEEESLIAPLKKVTPLSKYLVLTLFVLLPLLGGYVGYEFVQNKVMIQNVETVIATSSQVSSMATNTSLPTNTELQTIFENQFSVQPTYGPVIEPIYRSQLTGIIFVKTLTYSSRESLVYGFDIKGKSFFKTDFAISYADGEDLSPEGRYLTNIIDYYNPTTTISIIDLETMSTIKKVSIADHESFWSGGCGYGGPVFDTKWVSSSTFQYGVYAPEPKILNVAIIV
ncbi:MAG: hypothetical protein ACK4SL_02485 [Candidatus Paceibacteria bacterium]